MAVAFSSSVEEVLKRTVHISRQTVSDHSDEELSQCFELDRCSKWINDRSFRRVALQFPDDLLSMSVRVAQKLGSTVADCKLYILGDTSFGSCCVDEVAAEHAACQGVIHFGHSCLSPPSRLEVLLVLGVYPIDWTPLGLQLSQIQPTAFEPPSAASQPDKASQPADIEFLVIVDTKYCSQIDIIRGQLPSGAIIGHPIVPGDENPECEGREMFRRIFPTRRPLSDFRSLLWVGRDGQALVNVLLQFYSATVWAYDPETGTLQRQGMSIVSINRYGCFS
ncbi:diphthamide biosynthesis protein 2-like [Tropilaelaps mercedesae]|uniref:Diphthamide biosynthesis protein 2-like n=1 Tax=Tropilaelaps mercedesae TaxID=418985 RepID=A0A1V9XNG7_9ACAR|nr:diphthamide biosynthesis protein 2-like [Tropilaelaps mercedesae]